MFISIISAAFLSHQKDPSTVAIQQPLTRQKKFNLQLKKKTINFFFFFFAFFSPIKIGVTWSPSVVVSVWLVEESDSFWGLGLCPVLFLPSPSPYRTPHLPREPSRDHGKSNYRHIKHFDFSLVASPRASIVCHSQQTHGIFSSQGRAL